jgi:hypothetical protein
MAGGESRVFPGLCQFKTLPVVLTDTRIHNLLCVANPVDKVRKSLRLRHFAFSTGL